MTRRALLSAAAAVVVALGPSSAEAFRRLPAEAPCASPFLTPTPPGTVLHVVRADDPGAGVIGASAADVASLTRAVDAWNDAARNAGLGAGLTVVDSVHDWTDTTDGRVHVVGLDEATWAELAGGAPAGPWSEMGGVSVEYLPGGCTADLTLFYRAELPLEYGPPVDTAWPRSLDQMFIHEVGHLLGMDHEGKAELKIMHPVYPAGGNPGEDAVGIHDDEMRFLSQYIAPVAGSSISLSRWRHWGGGNTYEAWTLPGLGEDWEHTQRSHFNPTGVTPPPEDNPYVQGPGNIVAEALTSAPVNVEVHFYLTTHSEAEGPCGSFLDEYEFYSESGLLDATGPQALVGPDGPVGCDVPPGVYGLCARIEPVPPAVDTGPVWDDDVFTERPFTVLPSPSCD